MGEKRKAYSSSHSSYAVGHNRVVWLMRANGLNARPHKKFRVTAASGHKHEVAPNVVNREFRPEKPNQGWATSKSLSTVTLLQAIL